jgi:hypothetical protein
LALVLAAGAVWAQDATPGDSQTLPFAPPTGRPLHYRLVEERTDDKGVKSGDTFEQELVFDTAQPGLRLTITTPSVVENGRTFTKADKLYELATLDEAILLMVPAVLDLSANGAPTRLANFPDYLKAVEQLPEMAIKAAKSEQNRAAMRATLPQTRAAIDKATPESGAMPAAGIWYQLLGYGGLQFVPGKLSEWADLQQFMNGEAVVSYKSKLSVTPLPDGGYKIHRERVEDPDGFAEAIDTATARNDPKAIAEARQLRNAGAWVMDYTIIRTVDTTLDKQGLLRSAKLEERVERDGKSKGLKTTTVELIEAAA